MQQIRQETAKVLQKRLKKQQRKPQKKPMPQKKAVDAKDKAVTAVEKIQGESEKIVNVKAMWQI